MSDLVEQIRARHCAQGCNCVLGPACEDAKTCRSCGQQFPCDTAKLLDLLAERDAGEERWREATDHWRNKADIAWRQRDDAEATLQEETERANAAEARVAQLEGALRASEPAIACVIEIAANGCPTDQKLAQDALNHQGTETGGEGE